MAHIDSFNIESLNSTINQAFNEAVESLDPHGVFRDTIGDYENGYVHRGVIRRLGVDRALNPDLTYRSGNYTDLTLAGRLLAIAHVSWDYTSDYWREIDSWDAYHGHPANSEWSNSYGSPAYGYATLFPSNPELRTEDVAAIRCYAAHKVNELINEHNRKIRASRKDYGRTVNAELKAGGLNQEAINAYWRMNWRRECEPSEFVKYVNDSSINWKLAAAAKGWRLLEIAEAEDIQSSVTRCVDIAKAVCKARGEKRATISEVRVALKLGITADEVSPGTWRF